MNTASTNPHLVLLGAALLLCQLGCGHQVPISAAARSPHPAQAEDGAPSPSAESPLTKLQKGGVPEIATDSPTSATLLPEPAREPHLAEAAILSQTQRNPFRPPTVEVRHVTARQTTAADIRLLGFARNESHRFALLMKDHSMHKVQAGDSLGSWEVREIGEENVRLRRGREEIVLELN